jgi:hypothetical protein
VKSDDFYLIAVKNDDSPNHEPIQGEIASKSAQREYKLRQDQGLLDVDQLPPLFVAQFDQHSSPLKISVLSGDSGFSDFTGQSAECKEGKQGLGWL